MAFQVSFASLVLLCCSGLNSWIGSSYLQRGYRNRVKERCWSLNRSWQLPRTPAANQNRGIPLKPSCFFPLRIARPDFSIVRLDVFCRYIWLRIWRIECKSRIMDFFRVSGISIHRFMGASWFGGNAIHFLRSEVRSVGFLFEDRS